MHSSRLTDSRVISTLRAVPKAASAVVTLVGLLVLIGWMLDVPTLKSVFPKLVTMKANTSVAFLLSGLSLWLLQKKPTSQSRRWIGQVCAFTVVLIGLLTLSQYLFGWNLGIDQPVFRELPGAVGTSNLGRMAPNTALNFFLLGVALLLLNWKTRQSRWFVQFLCFIAAIVSFQPLLGYAYGFKSLYGIASHTRMALHTVLTFIVLCVGILFACPQRGLMRIVMSSSIGGFIARRLLLAAIAIPSVLGYLIVQGYRAGLYNSQFGLALLVMVSIIVFTVWIWQIAETLDRSDTERKRALAALQESEARFRAAAQGSFDAIYILQSIRDEAGEITDFKFIDLNARGANLISLPKEAVINQKLCELLPINRTDGFFEKYKQVVETGVALEEEFPISAPGVIASWLHHQVVPLGDGIAITSRDISDRKWNQALLSAQTRVLEMIATGAALPEVLDVLVRSIEEQSEEGICSLLLLNQDGTKLGNCIAPSIPESYKEAIKDGVSIGDCEGSCGTAVHRREPVIVSDIANDPLWAKYRHLPLSHGFQACWSTPIFASNGDVLGTFGIYYRTPREPSSYDRQLVEVSTHLAGIAIERKQAESALRDSEERFRKFFEEAAIGICVVELNGRFLKANKAYCEMIGYPESELNQLTFADITYPEDAGIDLSNAEQLFKGEIPRYQIEKRYIKKNGEILWVNLTATAICDSEGKACYGLGMAEDITERKQTQEALQDTNQTLQALIQACPLAITVFSLDDGKVTLWNPAASQIFGWSEQEVLGRFLPSVSEDKQEEFLSNLDFVRQGKTLTGLEARRQKKGGSSLDISIWAAPLSDAKGNISCMSIVADISDRKRLEAERAQILAREQAARTEAEAANRMKDEFLATLSHELRTPLNAMLGWTQMLRTRKFDEATTTRALETINRNTKSLATLIEDILDVSRIIRGKLNLNITPVELISVIEAAIDTVRPAAQAKAIRIESKLDPSLGLISGDANRLQQVVWNLLSNAVKFTPKGGQVEVRLEKGDRLADSKALKTVSDRAPIEHSLDLNLEADAPNIATTSLSNQPPNLQLSNPYVLISVNDTGKGIARDFLPYVFERFRQADSTTTRSYGGLGLGLAIVRHLVELHGGTVYADSPGEGQGATFSVQLPLVSVLTSANKLSSVSSKAKDKVPAESEPVLKGLRVLIVDDEADARELLTTILRQYGVDVTAVATASEVLEALPQVKPDVLVSDIGMPEEDGYSLIHKVRALDAEQGGHTPAVALTAYARAEDRTRALAAGFQLHIPKPVNPEELAAVVANLAGRNRKD